MGEVVDLRSSPRVVGPGADPADYSRPRLTDARDALKAVLPNVGYGPIDELLSRLWALGFKVVPLTSDDEQDGA